MSRAIILVLDSLGIGSAPDADRFGDAGADTLGHIAAWRAQQGRPLHLPHLTDLGLGCAAELATGRRPTGLEAPPTAGLYAAAAELSHGKDTPSGHWEMAGVPVTFDWGYFPRTTPCFPAALTDALISAGDLPGILGNCHASGTVILDELGAEHLATGKPILYTSADSVFQIAAHEDSFGLERLYALCRTARQLVDPYRIGRVIARPFVGSPGNFRRTGHRRDYAVPPPAPTLLDHLLQHGGHTIAIGKTADIFAHCGIGQEVKAEGLDGLMAATLDALDQAPDRSLIFSNFVDFDSSFGHRRDVSGYADALEQFDRLMPSLLARLRPGDLLAISADHGCDPTWPGTDHTREYVPILLAGPGLPADRRGHSAGQRTSFADLAASLAAPLGLPIIGPGRSLLI